MTNNQEIVSVGLAETPQMEQLIIPDTVKAIRDNAHSDKKGLYHVDLGRSVTRVGAHAFYWCVNLSQVDFSPSLRSIGYGAFSNTAIESMTLPSKLWHIEGSAFQMIRCLRSVITGSELRTVGDGAFFEDENLEEFTFTSAKIRSIHRNAFDGCVNLKRVIVPESLVSLYLEKLPRRARQLLVARQDSMLVGG